MQRNYFDLLSIPAYQCIQCLLPIPNVLVVVTKGMWAVKRCIINVLQFLTGAAD